MHWGGLAENMCLLTLYVYPSLILFVIWNMLHMIWMHKKQGQPWEKTYPPA